MKWFRPEVHRHPVRWDDHHHGVHRLRGKRTAPVGNSL
jgi:hypothetical protein